MFYIIALICSLLNVFLFRKYYALLILGLFIYFINVFIKIGFCIDINIYLIKLRYLIYIIFLLKFSLEWRIQQ